MKLKETDNTVQSTQLDTKSKQFKPNQQQLKWLKTALESKVGTVTAISEESGIGRKQWYRWLEVDGFEDWYYEAYERAIRTWRPAVDALGWKFANRGSTYHHEYLAERSGARQSKQDGAQVSFEAKVLVMPSELMSKYGVTSDAETSSDKQEAISSGGVRETVG